VSRAKTSALVATEFENEWKKKKKYRKCDDLGETTCTDGIEHGGTNTKKNRRAAYGPVFVVFIFLFLLRPTKWKITGERVISCRRAKGLNQRG